MGLKMKIAEALVASPVANRKIIIGDEESDEDEASTVKKTKYYNPPAKTL